MNHGKLVHGENVKFITMGTIKKIKKKFKNGEPKLCEPFICVNQNNVNQNYVNQKLKLTLEIPLLKYTKNTGSIDPSKLQNF